MFAAIKSVHGKLNKLKNPLLSYVIKCVQVEMSVSTLAPNGGHAKAIRWLTRLLVIPGFTKKIQLENVSQRMHKYLCGSKKRQLETEKVFESLLCEG